MNDFSAREDASDVSEPALQHFNVNPQRERIQPANLDSLPPVGRRVGIQIDTRKALQPHVMRTADISFSKNLFHEQISAHSEWRRTKHCHQFGITLGSREHLLSFSQIHRHPCLTK